MYFYVKLTFFPICFPGAISNTSSLFTYDTTYLIDNYQNAPKHDTSFVPVFSVPENPGDPLLNQATQICSGDGSQFCKYEKTDKCSNFSLLFSSFINAVGIPVGMMSL